MAVYSPQVLENLARKGAHIHIEGAAFIPAVLLNLARMTQLYGGRITISGNYLPDTIEQMAAIAGDRLTVIVKPEGKSM